MGVLRTEISTAYHRNGLVNEKDMLWNVWQWKRYALERLARREKGVVRAAHTYTANIRECPPPGPSSCIIMIIVFDVIFLIFVDNLNTMQWFWQWVKVKLYEVALVCGLDSTFKLNRYLKLYQSTHENRALLITSLELGEGCDFNDKLRVNILFKQKEW